MMLKQVSAVMFICLYHTSFCYFVHVDEEVIIIAIIIVDVLKYICTPSFYPLKGGFVIV